MDGKGGGRKALDVSTPAMGDRHSRYELLDLKDEREIDACIICC